MNLSTLSLADLYKQADATRREIEGMKRTGNIVALGDAQVHLLIIETEIMERTKE